MGKSGSILSEYIIRLGTEIDNQGMQKILELLDSGKLKALGITAALSAATTAVYKFIESSAKSELELRKLAKTQKKTIENTRASEQALKAMGVTLNDIKKDKALKSMYDDLVKFNKEMALPNMNQTMEKIDKLRGAFYKFRSAINYAVQWIGAQVMKNLEAPIERITGKLNDLSKWVRDNLNVISTKIGTFISDFAKGIIGIVEGAGKLFEWLNKMPDSVKAIAAAVGVVIALIKSGPIGQLLALITAIGDIIHDFENYQINKTGQDGYVATLNDYLKIGDEGIYDFLTGSTDPREKTSKISGMLFDAINGALEDLINLLNTPDGIDKWINQLTGPVGQIVSGLGDYFTSQDGQTAAAKLISNIFEGAASLITTGGKYGAQIAGAIASIFTNDAFWEDSSIKDMFTGENGFINALFSGLEVGTLTQNPLAGIFSGLVSLYHTEREKALRELAKGTQYEKADYTVLNEQFGNDSRLFSAMLSGLDGTGGLQADFNTMIEGVLEMLVGGVTITGQAAGAITKTLIKSIVMSIGGKNEAENTALAALNEIGDNNPIWDGLSTGIATWIATGSFLGGLFAGIADAIVEASNDPSGDAWKNLEKAAQEFVNMFDTILYGAIDENGNRNGKGLVSLIEKIWNGEGEDGGLKGLLKRLWEGEDGGGGLQDFFVTLFEPVGKAIEQVFINAFNSIRAQLPDWLVDILQLDQGKFTVTANGDGSVTLTNQFGEETQTSAETAAVVQNMGLEALRSQNIATSFGMLEGFPLEGGYLPSGFLSEFDEYQNAQVEPGDKHYAQERASQYAAAIKAAIENNDIPLLQYLNNLYTPGMSKEPGLFGEKWTNWLQDIYNGLNPSEEDIKNTPMGKKEEGKLTATTDKTTDKISDLGGATATTKGTVEGLGTSASSAASSLDGLAEGVSGVADSLSGANEKIGNLDFSVKGSGGEGEGETAAAAWGGRVNSRGHYLVGEDGPEYIIPITKPERAMSLLQNMFGEMGTNALARLAQGLGIGIPGTIGGSPLSMNSALAGMNMNTVYNITAPVSINVNASGASAEDIGKSAYNAAERHLVKTLMGVNA